MSEATDTGFATGVAPPRTGSIVHQPNDVDVVGARGGSWQAKHPGNLFYRDLVLESLQQLYDGVDPQQIVNEIINCINNKRGGVFLYQLPSGSGWRVMNDLAAKQKVCSALKNAEIKACRDANREVPRRKWGLEAPPKKPKLIKKLQAQPRPPKPLVARPVNPHPQIRSPQRPVVYEAKQGSKAIPDYTLKLISFMCNQSCPDDALVALDASILKHDETDSQRQIRLQLRHRYIAAMSIGMSPLTFSCRLIALWDGTVLPVSIPSQESSVSQEIQPSQIKKNEPKRKPTLPLSSILAPKIALIKTNSSPSKGQGKVISDDPGDMDVLLGRGGAANNWKGNRRFRERVQKWKRTHEGTPTERKVDIATHLVQSWKSEGGRFLERVKEGAGSIAGLWCVVSDERAKKKAFQALRSKGDFSWIGPSAPQNAACLIPANTDDT